VEPVSTSGTSNEAQGLLSSSAAHDRSQHPARTEIRVAGTKVTKVSGECNQAAGETQSDEPVPDNMELRSSSTPGQVDDLITLVQEFRDVFSTDSHHITSTLN
jgi:hypothetical protein